MDLVSAYREVCKEAKAAVDAEIKKEQEERHAGDSFILSYIRKQPLDAVLMAGLGTLAFATTTLTILGLSKIPAAIMDMIAILMILLQGGSVITVMVIFNVLNSSVTYQGRWQRIATKVRDLWFQKELDLASLKKAVELDIFFRKVNQEYFLGVIAVLALYVTLEKSVLGGAFFPVTWTIPLVVAQYGFPLIFSGGLILFFSFVHAPLEWSKQLGECILKEAFADIR